MQNMSQPPAYQGPPADSTYATDKVLGIIIMILSGCFVVLGGLGFLGGGFLAAGGAAGAASAGGTNAAGTAAAAGVGGAAIMIASAVLVIVALIGFAVGYGIMKSLRWGFLVGAVLYGLNALYNLSQMGHANGILGLLISAGLCVYCIMRLTGNLGPKPAL